MQNCQICDNQSANRVFQAREMLRGSRQEYNFLECSACGCVQLLHAPEDMTDYYANSSYGSFAVPERSSISRVLRKARNKQALLKSGGPLGLLMTRLMPLPTDYSITGQYATTASTILDVGCGAGAYLNDLAEAGFAEVSGVDPFIKNDIVTDMGVPIRKLYLEQLEGTYDVIVSHHSFEHVPNPLETLTSIRRLLSEDGVCLLTMPVVEDLYREYGADSYVLQAPQHFFLFSIRGMAILAEKAGLYVDVAVRDATTTGDWYKYSELWKRDVSVGAKQGSVDDQFTRTELKEFKDLEKRMNREGKGDNVTFVLRSRH